MYSGIAARTRCRTARSGDRHPPILAACLLALFAWSAASPVAASGMEGDVRKASTSRAAREDARRSIPVSKIDGRGRAKLNRVLSDTSVFRRLPVQVIDCEPDLFRFMIRNPDVIVNIWDVMGITQVGMQRTGETTFVASDGVGTSGNVEFLYRSDNLHVVYTEGVYDGPAFTRPVRGQCVMVLKTGYAKQPSGRCYISNRLDIFIRLENVGLELLAKTFHPWMGKIADTNFAETSQFLGSVSRTAETNSPGVTRLAGKLTSCPFEVRQEFAMLSADVAAKLEPTQMASSTPAAPARAIRQPKSVTSLRR